MPKNSSNPIPTAMIGYGYSASTIHAPLIQASADVNLVAVVSSQPEKIAQELPGVRCYPDVASLLNEEYIELVVIASPNDTHFDIASQCLNRGCHVVIDKPWVVNKSEGEALVKLSQQLKKHLSVFQNRRWDGDFLTLKQLIAENALGKIRHVESHFDRYRPHVRERWREQAGRGSGIWYDLGPHLVDQAYDLFGLPMHVSATCRAMREGSQAIDYFHVQLHYQDHNVVLQSNPFCLGDTLRFDVQGEKARFIKYGLDTQEEALKSGANPDSERWANSIENTESTLVSTKGETLIETESGLYEDFYGLMANAIQENCAPPVLIEDALAVIDIVERVETAVSEGIEKSGFGRCFFTI